MKTLTALCAVALATVPCHAQTVVDLLPEGVAMNSLTTIQTSSTDIKTALDQLLEKATKQLEDLDKQLQRSGDYLAANNASVTSAGNAIQTNGITTTKTTAQLTAERASVTGDNVFSDSADGAFKGIGETYTKKEKNAEGKMEEVTKNRDPERYKEEAKKLYDISEFYRVRDEALTKQQELEAARLQAHLDLLQTQDQVETQRLTAQIATMDSELIAVRADVVDAAHELEMHEKEMTLQSIVDSKAKAEKFSRSKAPSSPESIQALVDKLKQDGADRAAAKKAAVGGDTPFFQRLRPKKP